ncbi:hypothetical protein [Cytobacillus purgationiresistens]|uniref:SLH domain-containing protein n=1 Tax=Cytobacillus purgationiresistens TaxID=863449 RepID=A0ABU0AR48_9BACI|nr:hypothetical protein [Cytobacillus purgationiresistens]MDQ0273722.1 hypothetical protein [Cytobacillus purgationiresistens]
MKHYTSSILFLLLLLIATSNVDAHITNEKSLYEDISISEAKEEIMYLRAMNVITAEDGVNLYRPTEMLTREVLATWALNFNSHNNVSQHSSDHTTSPEEAIEYGLMDTLEGNATFNDINKAFFNETLSISSNKEITREEFALFMGEHWSDKVDEKDLFDRSGLSSGPKGLIEDVLRSDNKDELSKVLMNGEEYHLSLHPKIVNGPTDEELFIGLTVTDSYTRVNENGTIVLDLIKMEEEESRNESVAEEAATHSKINEEESKGFGTLALLTIPLLIIIIWLISKPIIRKFKRND